VAYFVGIRYGKHKLFPRVSPAKSWEGALAGFLAAAAGFWAFSMWLMPDFPTWLALTCGALVGVVGQLGDLAESLLKRDATIKDSSHLIPGHGGLLDRFDSMLFAAPMVLILLTIVSSVGQ
jgi:phosphatidate cytidylyltransferase